MSLGTPRGKKGMNTGRGEISRGQAERNETPDNQEKEEQEL